MDRTLARHIVPFALATLLLSLFSGCGTSVLLGESSPDGGPQPSFAPPTTEDAGDAASSIGACPSNECPAGRTTCPNSPYPCAVDVMNDNNNCGACGNYCPTNIDLLPFFATSSCVNGECTFACVPPVISADMRNCNGVWDDGCETDVLSDKENCGGCGVVCAANEECKKGICSCAVESCGGCGVVCPAPPSSLPELPSEWHANYGCDQATGFCYARGCMEGWLDCNDDLAGDPSDAKNDGCEVARNSDPMNCGACGAPCAPGETCVGGNCKCSCGSSCFDTTSNPENCGACGVVCPSGDPNLVLRGKPACRNGLCEYRCELGWADCDGNIRNGCETNVAHDPLNCGACGVRCNGIEGQPCIDGRCATKECEVR